MSDSGLPLHWRFAAAQASAGLRELVHSFDFLGLADGHTYVGIEPSCLVDFVDGFLRESEDVVPSGNRAELQQLRQLLVEEICPVYEEGKAAGRRRWHELGRFQETLSTEELHQVAMRLAPVEARLRGRFADGFCLAYASAEFQSIGADSLGRGS